MEYCLFYNISKSLDIIAELLIITTQITNLFIQEFNKWKKRLFLNKFH